MYTLPKVIANKSSYQKQLSILRDEINRIINLKDKWKKGQMIVEDFSKITTYNQQYQFTNKIIIDILDQLRINLLDLMKDIEVLTEIDYPKLLSYNIFNQQQALISSDNQIQIKILLQQLRQQTIGKITPWDLQIDDNNNNNFKIIIRNLKINLFHILRQNLQIKTYHHLPKKDGTSTQQDIKKILYDILRGFKK